MNINNYIFARKYAMEYGTFLGIAWLVDFIFLTKGIDNKPALLLFGCGLFLFLPFLTCYLAFRFKQHQPVGEHKTLGCAAYFAVMMFVFAELITFIGEYAYFAYIDHGHIMATFQSMLEDPVIVAEYQKMGMTDFLSTARLQLEQMSVLSPADLAASLLGSNILSSFILFIPTWIIAAKRAKDYTMNRFNDSANKV